MSEHSFRAMRGAAFFVQRKARGGEKRLRIALTNLDDDALCGLADRRQQRQHDNAVLAAHCKKIVQAIREFLVQSVL